VDHLLGFQRILRERLLY
jgi:hypothetical protein